VYTLEQQFKVPPNHGATLKLGEQDTVLFEPYRYNRAQPTEYEATFSAVGGSRDVREVVRFTVAGAVPTLTALEPADLIPGATVELRGTALGRLRIHNKVTFAGVEATEIVSWADDRVKVKVPAGVRSGTVKLWRGEVASNELPYTVRTETSRSFTLAWGKEGENVRVTAAIDVTAVGSGAGWQSVFEERSNFDPEQWVRLYFGTVAPPAGGSNQYSVTVNVLGYSSAVHQGSITFKEARWVVRSQTPDGLPTSTVTGNTVLLTEAASPYSKQAELMLVFTNTGSNPARYTISRTPPVSACRSPRSCGDASVGAARRREL